MTVLIIGLGSIGKKHVKAIQQLRPEAEIFALRSGSTNNTVKGVQNITELFKMEINPDFVLISNPTSEHFKTIKRFIPLGRPLFIEKPSLMSLTGAEVLRRELEQKGITTYVACNLRFHPVIEFLRDEVKNKNLNEVNIYCGSYLPEWRAGIQFRDCYSAKKELGGGVHLDLIHELDYAYWIFGAPKEVNSTKRYKSTLRIEAVDYARYELLYSRFAVNIVLNYYRRDYKRKIELVFEDDTWTADLTNGSIMNMKGEDIFRTAQEIADTYTSQMKYFISYLGERKQPMNDLKESIEVLKICLHEEAVTG